MLLPVTEELVYLLNVTSSLAKLNCFQVSFARGTLLPERGANAYDNYSR